MRYIAALAAAALCLLLALPVPADPPERDSGPRPVSGNVRGVDAGSRTLSLGAETFFVPAEVFDLSQLEAGAVVVVHWELRGGRRVATRIDHRAEGG